MQCMNLVDLAKKEIIWNLWNKVEMLTFRSNWYAGKLMTLFQSSNVNKSGLWVVIENIPLAAIDVMRL